MLKDTNATARSVPARMNPTLESGGHRGGDTEMSLLSRRRTPCGNHGVAAPAARQ